LSDTSAGPDRYRSLVESCSDAIVAWGADHRVTFANPAAEHLFGRSVADLLGRPFAELMADDRRAAEAALAGAAADGEPVGEHETAVVRPDGRTVAAAAAFFPVGALGEVGAVFRDLTAWHTLSEARQASFDRQARVERLESVGRLAGGIAHDFNNLMAVVLNYASFVAQQVAGDPVAAADVEQIRDAATRAAHLTRQLLMVSRVEPLLLETLDLNETVAEVTRLLPIHEGELVELHLELSPDVPPVRTARGGLEHVLLNLITNACESMPGGGTVTVRTEVVELDGRHDALGPERPPGRYVRLSVIDTGAGMSAETADLAFEPFFSTKPKDAGLGLGLASVYGIMADAGGLVELSSEEGRGTTVHLFLPVARRDGGPDPSAAPGPEAADEACPPTVLLVEDEDAMRRLTARILRRNGFSVVEAATGSEALRLADGEPRCDLLLTDVIMPEMSGKELADRLRDRQGLLPVLFMSGYSQGALGHDGVIDPGTDLLEKPFDEQALVDRVRSILSSVPH